jgi:hypothetical protein
MNTNTFSNAKKAKSPHHGIAKHFGQKISRLIEKLA